MSIKSTPEGYLVDIRPQGRASGSEALQDQVRSPAVRALGDRHRAQ
jgi:hypothetical protein